MKRKIFVGENRTIKRVSMILLTLVLVICMTMPLSIPAFASSNPQSFKAHVALPFEEVGTLNNAAYRIRVPANWNGTLLVYAHGLDLGQLSPPIRVAPGREGTGSEDIEGDLIDLGYALAGSSYSDSGWAVKVGIQDTLALTNYFNGRVGKPEHVILWGLSMGGVIALESVEKYPGIYDGVIAESANSAGAPMNFDHWLFFQVVYDVLFDWPDQWGEVGDVRDDINFNTDVIPIVVSKIFPPSGKSEILRLACGQPFNVFYFWGGWGLPMALATTQAASLEKIAKGPCLQNLDAATFSLSQSDIYKLINDWGMNEQTIIGFIDEINARRNIEASISARNYLERYATFTGDIKRPVITIHNFFDPFAEVANSGVYRDIVNSAGRGDLLLQAYTNTAGHGVFTKDQYLQTINAMQYWLDTGTKPDPATFFSALYGFIPGFVPPPWPYTQ